MDIHVQRQWNDYRIGKVSSDNIDYLHWDKLSGGVNSIAPQPFVHGYTLCTDVEGDIAHSHVHGPGPHRIKVCIVKKDISKAVWDHILQIAGPKPKSQVLSYGQILWGRRNPFCPQMLR